MVDSVPSPLSAQFIFEGAHELLGQERMEQIAGGAAVSEASLPQAWNFLWSLESIYGIPGGRGLAFRIGQAAFKYALKSACQEGGLRDKAFYLLPHQRRLETGLRILAADIGREWDQMITVTDSGTRWIWRVEGGPDRPGCKFSEPCCHALAGLLQAYMTWAGGGRYYRVIQTECCVSGDPACVFQIEKKPLD